MHRFVGLELGQEQGIGDVGAQPGHRLAGLTDCEAEEVISGGGPLSVQGPAGQQGRQYHSPQPPRSVQRSCQRSSTPSDLPSASRNTLSR